MNLVQFNSFKANTFENNDFVIFRIKLDTHAQRDVHTKQMHSRALRTLTETDFFIFLLIGLAIVYLGDRVGTTLQSGFEVILALCVCSVITGLTFLALHHVAK